MKRIDWAKVEKQARDTQASLEGHPKPPATARVTAKDKSKAKKLMKKWNKIH